MNEMQQILDYLKKLDERMSSLEHTHKLAQASVVTRLSVIENGQESIKTELHNTRKELTAKIEAVKTDTEAIRASLEVGTGSFIDDIKYLQHKIFKLEQRAEKLEQASHTAK